MNGVGIGLLIAGGLLVSCLWATRERPTEPGDDQPRPQPPETDEVTLLDGSTATIVGVEGLRLVAAVEGGQRLLRPTDCRWP